MRACLMHAYNFTCAHKWTNPNKHYVWLALSHLSARIYFARIESRRWYSSCKGQSEAVISKLFVVVILIMTRASDYHTQAHTHTCVYETTCGTWPWNVNVIIYHAQTEIVFSLGRTERDTHRILMLFLAVHTYIHTHTHWHCSVIDTCVH